MVVHRTTYPRITRTPGVVGGEPVVKGTRIPVRVIVQCARISHNNLVEVNEAYPTITRADIEEALAYYEANRAEIDRFIAENEDDED